jgi:hypothetical protein
MAKEPETVWDLPRNDVEACARYYKRRGMVSADEMRVMLRLQDDPAELEQLAADWKVRADS